MGYKLLGFLSPIRQKIHNTIKNTMLDYTEIDISVKYYKYQAVITLTSKEIEQKECKKRYTEKINSRKIQNTSGRMGRIL
ncbi:hypothetical protein WKV44_02205 [Spirochaetia bacterium 38H-sp]|uniref:Uncharacterized protein n=1 Tax=Rarispira pelagica TaxID=3141764 RepID=A0ABU9U9K4_9SPIR